MTETLNYYLSAYLHQDWNDECNSQAISDHWDFFFKNESAGVKNHEIELGNKLIIEIENVIKMGDYEIKTIFHSVNYHFNSVSEIKDWLSDYKSWILKRIL